MNPQSSIQFRGGSTVSRQTERERERQPERRAGRSVPVPLLIAAVAVALLIVFAVQNRQTVPVSFLVFDATTSLIWALAVAAVLGVILGYVAGWRRHRRRE